MSASEPRPSEPELQSEKTSFVTSRPVAVLMVFVAAVVFGVLSYSQLPVTLMPEMSYPTVTVRTEYPGAAPEEVENDVSRRIEEVLGVVAGLRRMSSISRAGVSDVVLEFSWDTKMSDAIQDTLEKLDLVFLPTEAERPLILRFDPSLDPVMELSLSGSGDRFKGDEGLRRLRRIAELQVKRSLEPIKGVAAVKVRGGLEEEIHVLLDAQALRRSRLSAQNVIDRLAEENINVAGGTLKEGRTEYMVRTVNEYVNLDEIRDTVVTTVDDREIRISDLGEVVRSNKEREILTRTEGRESVQLDVFKEADANMVALAKIVTKAVGELDLDPETGLLAVAVEEGGGGRRGPNRGRRSSGGLAEDLFKAEGANLEVVADRSKFIEGSINEVRNTAVLGGLLAVIILYLFLRNFLTTLIVAVSIPISLLITFAPLNVLGVSLNIMSLGGLALGVGMLVDSSIVVLESIFRCREEGDGLVDSAVRGTEEVSAAVMASVFTSIAVFFPMVFIEGIAGQAFGDLGLAVVISLLASLAVALLFIPMLASRRGVAMPTGKSALQRLRSYAALGVFKRDFASLRHWMRDGSALRYLPALLGFVFLAVRLVVGSVLELVAKVLLLLIIAIAFLVGRLIWPVVSRVFFVVSRVPVRVTGALLDGLNSAYPPILRTALRWPIGVLLIIGGTIWSSVWMLGQLETELLPEVRQGEFTFEVALPVGTPLEESDRILSGAEQAILSEREHIQKLLLTIGYDATNSQRSDEGEHTARFKVLLESSNAEEEQEVVGRLRAKLAQIPDLTARVARPVLFSFKTPIEVEVHGDDLDELKRYGDLVAALMSEMPELADVESTLRSGAPEVQIVYDRALLARYELNVQTVAQMVRNQVKGFEATLYNLKDRRVPIIVRLDETDRRSTDDLNRLVVNPGSDNRAIQLGAVAAVELGEGPSEVRRVDSRRVALVRSNLGEASLGTAVSRIEDVLSTEVDWPANMSFVVAGQSQEWERSKSSLWLALGLSIFLVYVIMAAQFESLLHPLVIMFTIPLAFFGTVLTLYVLGVNLSIVVFLGMIMLAGIVVNNAIVLVDYINTLKSRGLGRHEAIIQAGSIRLRPILMTTATTALGLLPMALGLGEGAEIRTPMALAVIGGLTTSTLLTLLVVPVVYSLFDGLQSRLLGRKEPAAEPAAEAPPLGAAEGTAQ